MESSLAISNEVKYTLIIQPRIYIPAHLFQKSENFSPRKNLYTNVHSKFFIRVKNWKQPKYPTIGEWLNKLVYLYHEILLRKQKE